MKKGIVILFFSLLMGNLYSQNWEYLGRAGISPDAVNYPQMTLSSTGTPYIVFSDYAYKQKISVMRFNNESWEYVGIPGFSSDFVVKAAIALDGSIPYVFFSDAGSNVTRVMKFNNSSNSWIDVGNLNLKTTLPQEVSITVHKGVPYIAYQDFTIRGGATVRKYDFLTNSWLPLGRENFTLGQVSSIQIHFNQDIPYILFQDLSNNYALNLVRFNGLTWDPISREGLPEILGGHPALVFHENYPVVAYSDKENLYKTTVKKFDGTVWKTLGTEGFSASYSARIGPPIISSYHSLSIHNGSIYVSYTSNDKPTVRRFNGTMWEVVGNESFTPYWASGLSMGIAQNKAYVAFSDGAEYGNAKLSVMSLDLPCYCDKSFFIKSNMLAICNGQKAKITASNCGGIVSWNNNLGEGVTKEVSPEATTEYKAFCKLNDTTIFQSNTLVVKVHTLPFPPTLTAFGIENSKSVTLSSSYCNGITTWYNTQNGGKVLSISKDFVVADASKIYYASCTDNGCISTDRSSVNGLTLDICTPIITTFAGNGTPQYVYDGQMALEGGLSPNRIAIDKDGSSILVSDMKNAILRINKEGQVKVIAGTWSGNYGGNGRVATDVPIYNPSGMVVDKLGNIYFSETFSHVIRKIDTKGIINTIAGTGGVEGYNGDGGLATSARLYYPVGIALDDSNNIYVADEGNNRIRKINNKGIITTIAGTGVRGYSGDGGKAVNATLNSPNDIAIDNKNNVYFSDYYNSAIRKISPDGTIYTYIGGYPDFAGDGGPAINAFIHSPTGVQIDKKGNMYISGGGRVRKVDVAGNISTIAGISINLFRGDGATAIDGGIGWGNNVAIDNNDNVYISDVINNRIRKISAPAPSCTTVVISSDKTKICFGQSINLKATGCNGGTITWNNDLGVGASKTISPANTAKYVATCNVNGLVNNSNTETVTVVSLPTTPTVAPVTIFSGETATLTAQGCLGNVAWYNVSQNGAVIDTAKIFKTPALSSNATYYASCTVNGCTSTTRGSALVTVKSVPSTKCVVNKARLKFREDCCFQRLEGAIIQGSDDGKQWNTLHTINESGTGQWQEFLLTNSVGYNQIRLAAGPKGFGEIHELEFYNNNTKLTGTPFGTAGKDRYNGYEVAFDGNEAGIYWHGFDNAPGVANYAGLILNKCEVQEPVIPPTPPVVPPTPPVNPPVTPVVAAICVEEGAAIGNAIELGIYNFDVTSAGKYKVKIYYRSTDNPEGVTALLSVNGVEPKNIHLPSTINNPDFINEITLPQDLITGKNNLKFTWGGAGFYFISKVCVEGPNNARLGLGKEVSITEVYPNPATKQVFVKLNGLKGQDLTLDIVNLKGQKLFEKQLKVIADSQTETVDVSNFEQGTYLLNIKSKDYKSTFKVTKRQ